MQGTTCRVEQQSNKDTKGTGNLRPGLRPFPLRLSALLRVLCVKKEVQRNNKGTKEQSDGIASLADFVPLLLRCSTGSFRVPHSAPLLLCGFALNSSVYKKEAALAGGFCEN